MPPMGMSGRTTRFAWRSTGNERPYNALRLALNLVKRPSARVRVFLMADAVTGALAGQKTPTGYYNIERMMSSIARRGEVAT